MRLFVSRLNLCDITVIIIRNYKENYSSFDFIVYIILKVINTKEKTDLSMIV